MLLVTSVKPWLPKESKFSNPEAIYYPHKSTQERHISITSSGLHEFPSIRPTVALVEIDN